MRIGIDAKWYYSGPPSGVNVVRNIVDSLIEFNITDEIIFFLSKKDAHLIEDFKNKIRNHINLSFTFIPNKINFLTNTFFFPFYFYNKKLDVILFQNYIPLWGGRKTKYIDYVHDFLFLDYPQYFTKIEKLIYLLMLYSVKKANHVITISQSERRRIIKHSKIQSNKISFVYHGLDSIFYERSESIKASIKNKYKLPAKYVLYLGRINIRKNIKTLIRAFPETNHNISLVIVGKEENMGCNLKEEINKLGLNDKVYIIGYVPDNDLAEIVSAASIFVFPSYAEGFGLPPLEAMKSGIPTIISNLTSLPEICGDAALTFNADDSSELASKINFLLTNSEAYSSYKIKGIKKSQEFSWGKSISLISDIMKNVADNT